ncbi:acyltransferase [Enterobacteriaceae bacterium ESL0689]|nr:acyltransferase [Enterobacteriaceae bacterium ESL0689]
MYPDKSRLVYLDALRGIAASTVVFSHYAERTPVHRYWIFDFFTPGQFGVVVFFLLSGFVIPFSLKQRAGGIRDFIISRFFRLYPAYWLSIFLAVILAYFFTESPISGDMALANLTMLQKLLGYPDALGVYWTLLVELAFYFVCTIFAVAGVLFEIKFRFYISILFLFVSVFASIIRYLTAIPVPVGIVVSLSLMFFGSVWRDATLNKNRQARQYSVVWGLLFVVFFPVISFLVYDIDRGLGESAYSYIGSFFTGIIFFLLFTAKVKLKSKVPVSLGLISYSIYLTHPIILGLTNKAVDLSSSFNLLAFTGYISGTIVLAALSYFLIEKPGIALGRKVKKKLSSGTEA